MKRRNRLSSSAQSPELHRADVSTARPFGPKDWFFVVALLVAVILAYHPAWQGGFIWDDDLLLLNNPVLKPGGLLDAWVPGTYLNYWPLTSTAYRLQFDIWGLNPLGYHLVNIVLHAISALLVWRILLQLNAPGAMFAAALFALHPVNVESVAWISQLKNILSLLLALLSVLLYLLFEEKGKRWCMVLSIAAFLLSALSKGMVLTLPVVLLACAWWQRGRIRRQDLLRVLPFLLIGAVMACVEVWGQHLVGDGETIVRSDSLLSRAAVAGCAVWFYLGKLIWPVKLIFVYPRWSIDPRDVLSYLPGVLLVAILALGWWQRRGWGRPVVMLMVCYVGLLLPALGFVNIAFMQYSLVADHWQYAAMIVPCAVFAAVTARLGRRLWHRPTGYALCLASLAVLAGLTWQQSRMYADVETLYRTVIAENPTCWMVHYNLAVALSDRGQIDEAIAHYRKTLEVRPDFAEAHYNLGMALAQRGQDDEAIVHYRKALQIKPGYAEFHNNLGLALASRKQIDEAITHYQKALEINPDFAEAHNNLGIALNSRGQFDEALVQFQKAMEVKSDKAEFHNNLGLALANRKQIDAAITHYQKALQIKPDYTEAYNNLGVALGGSGRLEEAIVQYQKALEINPNHADTLNNFGLALAQCGRLDEAITQYEKAVKIRPHYAEALDNLGNALAGCGRTEEAIACYQKAVEVNPDYAEAYSNLGLALAGRGRVEEAIANYRKALESKPDSAAVHNNLGLALAGRGEIDEALGHYRQALAVEPKYAEAHNNLANALANRGEIDEAMVHYRKALEAKPDYAGARRNLEIVQSRWEEIRKALAGRRELLRSRPDDITLLNDTAWMLATNPNASIRNGAEAVELAQRADQLCKGQEPAILGTLAAAYAEAARFPQALETAERALTLATNQNNSVLADTLRIRIKLYQSGFPYRDAQQASVSKSVRP